MIRTAVHNYVLRIRDCQRSLLTCFVAIVFALGLVNCTAIDDLTTPSLNRTLSLKTSPDALPQGGGEVVLEATVMLGAAPEIGIPVQFRADAGQFGDGDTAITDGEGVARVRLRVTVTVAVSAVIEVNGIVLATSAEKIVPVGDDFVANGAIEFAVKLKPQEPKVDKPVSIEVRATKTDDGSAAEGTLKIEFGDGKQEIIPNFRETVTVEHTFRESSMFELIVSLTEPDGNLSVESFPLQVESDSRLAIVLSAARNEAIARQDLEFTVLISEESSRRPTGKVRIVWDDGRSDNLGEVVGSAKVTHDYRQPGSYRPLATLTAKNGRTARSALRVRIHPPVTIDSGLTPSQQSVAVNEKAAFTFTVSLSNGSNPSGKVTVLFGDTTDTTNYRVTSSTTAFDHRYRSEGNFQVSAVFTDDAGLTAKETATVTVVDDGGNGLDEWDMSKVNFVSPWPNVSRWKITSSIPKSQINIQPGKICVPHSLSGTGVWDVWKDKPGDIGAEGHIWVVFKVKGQLYAHRVEWMPFGITCYTLGTSPPGLTTRDHIGPKGRPAANPLWKPKKGEMIGLFVSSLIDSMGTDPAKARQHERSQVVKIAWPY